MPKRFLSGTVCPDPATARGVRGPGASATDKGKGMKQLRRLLISLAGGTVLAACTFPGVLIAAAPASSGIVIRFEDVFLVAYEDPADNLVAVTGPSLELGCQGLGFDEYVTSLQAADTPTGAFVLHVHVSEVPIHVYSGSSIGELCDIAIDGGTLDPIASGMGRLTANDNDVFVSGTRMNSFGDTTTGTLASPDGTVWSFTGAFRALSEGTEDGQCICRVIREDITLKPRGG